MKMGREQRWITSLNFIHRRRRGIKRDVIFLAPARNTHFVFI